MLLLKVVALGSIRGYLICQRIQQGSTDVLQLYRMEQKKWLSAGWREKEGGREAKFYALPRQRWKQLEVEAAAWTRLADAIGLAMRTTE